MTENQIKARLENEAEAWVRMMVEKQRAIIAARTRADRHARNLEALVWVSAIAAVAMAAALMWIWIEVGK